MWIPRAPPSLRGGAPFGPGAAVTGTTSAPGPAISAQFGDHVAGMAGPYNRLMSDHPAPGFGSLTLEAFLEQLASSAPIPGGGSASAVAAGLAAGLVAMVAGLSVDRPAYVPFASTHARAGAAGRELAGRLLGLADEDAAAYGAFAAAMRLPRGTDAETATRSAAIRAAAVIAAEVPLRTLEACRDVVLAAEALAGRSNRNAASDLVVASRLAEAAAHGAAENVMVNVPALGDEEQADELGGRVATLLAEVADHAESTRAFVELGELREPEPEPLPA
jgi:formiminotetrahydrofolate cyclodeaminase